MKPMKPMYSTAAEERLVNSAIKAYGLLLKMREPEYSDAIYRAHKKAGKNLEDAIAAVVRERKEGKR